MAVARIATSLLLVLLAAPPPAVAATFTSYALVNEDATLRIRGRTVRLYGIYVPPTDEICREYVRPVQCGPRPALALDFKVGSHFITCQEIEQNRDGTVTAQCLLDGEDLSEWMLRNGWAAALPGAPFEYEVAERLAERRGLGIWGIPLDRIERRRLR